MTIDGEEYWTDQTEPVGVHSFEIESAEATEANTIVVTFEEAVPEDTLITVQKSTLTNTTTGTVTFSEDYKTATFVAGANFTTGTYIVTATSGDLSDTAEVEITTQKVKSIEITSTTALTEKTQGALDPHPGLKTEAYVYYKVYDQYDVDITENTAVEANASYSVKKVDRNTGCITLENVQGFRYNDLVTVSIVHTQTGTVATKSLNVGFEQYVDSVSVEGFLSLAEPTKLQSTLPAGFNKDEWLVLFKAYDQDGNEMDVDNYDFTTDITVTTPDTLLVGTNSFKAGSTLAAKGGADTYTIDGQDYSAFTIQPGLYVDKGGTATLNIISNKTGTQSSAEVEIGAQGVLQSLVLLDPGTVTDGDTVEIPYTATTTTGDTTTDYETIVRSTNTLSLTASSGTLTISENNDGSAKIRWSDTDLATVGNYADNIDRPITFTPVVVGGETSNSTIYVSDYAYPVTITTTALPEYMVQGDNATSTTTIDLGENGKATYVDQYGRTMDAATAQTKLLKIAKDGGTSKDFAIVLEKTAGTTIEAHLEHNNSGTAITTAGKQTEYFQIGAASAELGDLTVTTFDADAGAAGYGYNRAAETNTLKLSIETKKNGETADKYAAAGKKLTETVTTVGLDKLTNFAIKPINNTVNITTDASTYDNLREAIDATSGTAGEITESGNLTITAVAAKGVTVTGTYNGTTITVPSEFYIDAAEAGANIAVDAASKLTKGATTTIAVNKLYSTTAYERKTAELPVTVKVFNLKADGSGLDTTFNKVSTTIGVQDGARKATTIKFYDSSANEVTSGTFNATSLDYNLTGATPNLFKITNGVDKDIKVLNTGKNVYYAVFDQYGDLFAGGADTFKITEIKENEGEYANVSLEGFGVSANQTNNVAVTNAELGDTFTLTVSSDGASATIAITQGSDNQANVSNKANADQTFRKAKLGYDR